MSITLKDIHFAYPEAKGVPILSIQDWSIKAGENVFIHGPSGSGKSTFLNILSGMIKPESGTVEVLDQRIDQMSAHQRDLFRAGNIGYVFQAFNLIPYLDAIDNIKLAIHFSKKKHKHDNEKARIESLLTKLNITAEHWHKPAKKLSMGQQQRIAIARALINQPEVIIADEPTSSLDSKNREDFMSVLLPLVKETNSTLVFVSHDMTLSNYFDRTDEIHSFNTVGSNYARGDN